MDTTKLVVGQYVLLESGGFFEKMGTVIKVTPAGVEVRTPIRDWFYTTHAGKLIQSTDLNSPHEVWRFDIHGNAVDSRGTGMYLPGLWEQYTGIPTTECAIWKITETEDYRKPAERPTVTRRA